VWDLRTLDNVDTEPQYIRETTDLELRTIEAWLNKFDK
jgi:hypothetical protein